MEVVGTRNGSPETIFFEHYPSKKFPCTFYGKTPTVNCAVPCEKQLREFGRMRRHAHTTADHIAYCEFCVPICNAYATMMAKMPLILNVEFILNKVGVGIVGQTALHACCENAFLNWNIYCFSHNRDRLCSYQIWQGLNGIGTDLSVLGNETTTSIGTDTEIGQQCRFVSVPLNSRFDPQHSFLYVLRPNLIRTISGGRTDSWTWCHSSRHGRLHNFFFISDPTI